MELGNDVVLQLGLGGTLALLLIREVLGFVRNLVGSRREPVPHPNGMPSGERSVDYWKVEITAAVSSALMVRVLPLLEEIKSTQKDDLETIRDKFHSLNNSLTEMLLALELIKSRMRGGGNE